MSGPYLVVRVLGHVVSLLEVAKGLVLPRSIPGGSKDLNGSASCQRLGYSRDVRLLWLRKDQTRQGHFLHLQGRAPAGRRFGDFRGRYRGRFGGLRGRHGGY